MTLKIEISDNELGQIKEKLHFARTSGKGVLTDSWLIAEHLKGISKRVFNSDLSEFNVTGFLLGVKDNRIIISGANLPTSDLIKKLLGKEFKVKSRNEVVDFKLTEIVSELQHMAKGKTESVLPLSFVMTSVSFKFEKLSPSADRQEFYSSLTLNEGLMKSLGFPVLKSGEVALHCHLMDFEFLPNENIKSNDSALLDFAGSLVD